MNKRILIAAGIACGYIALMFVTGLAWAEEPKPLSLVVPIKEAEALHALGAQCLRGDSYACADYIGYYRSAIAAAQTKKAPEDQQGK